MLDSGHTDSVAVTPCRAQGSSAIARKLKLDSWRVNSSGYLHHTIHICSWHNVIAVTSSFSVDYVVSNLKLSSIYSGVKIQCWSRSKSGMKGEKKKLQSWVRSLGKLDAKWTWHVGASSRSHADYRRTDCCSSAHTFFLQNEGLLPTFSVCTV